MCGLTCLIESWPTSLNPALDGNLTMGIVEDTKDNLLFSNWEAQTVAELYNIPDRLRLKKEIAKVSEYQKLLQQVNSLLSTHHAQSRLDNPLESAKGARSASFAARRSCQLAV